MIIDIYIPLDKLHKRTGTDEEQTRMNQGILTEAVKNTDTERMKGKPKDVKDWVQYLTIGFAERE